MRRIEKTIARVGLASTIELVGRETKCNKPEVSMKGDCLRETAAGDGLCLDDTGNYHDANSAI